MTVVMRKDRDRHEKELAVLLKGSPTHQPQGQKSETPAVYMQKERVEEWQPTEKENMVRYEIVTELKLKADLYNIMKKKKLTYISLNCFARMDFSISHQRPSLRCEMFDVRCDENFHFMQNIYQR